MKDKLNFDKLVILSDCSIYRPVTALSEGTKFSRNKFLEVGKYKYRGEELNVDEQYLFDICNNLKKTNRQVFVDKDHQALWGNTESYGWVDQRFEQMPDPNTGRPSIYCDVDWTEEGRNLVMSGKFRFFSPAWFINYSDKSGENFNLMAYTLSLTNNPFLGSALQAHMSDPTFYSFGCGCQKTQGEEKKMKNLFKKLGLSETPTEEEAIKAVEKLETKIATMSETMIAKTNVVSLADYNALKSETEAAKKQVADLKIEGYIKEAQAIGKWTPANDAILRKNYSFSKEEGDAILAVLPVVVKDDVRGTRATEQGGADFTKKRITMQEKHNLDKKTATRKLVEADPEAALAAVLSGADTDGGN